ncbi:MAG: hypothetical protein NDI60_08690 [Elusimicrobiales bacterium]|nr:hypothetical protein [Elusimicrobiales bacterium]
MASKPVEKAIRLEARTAALLAAGRGKLAAGLKKFDSVYIGAEFCENLLPPPAELARQAAFFLKLGKQVRVLTPLVTEKGLGRLAGCIKTLLRLGGGAHAGRIELTVNDIGAARLARELAPKLPVALGRLLYDNVFLFRKDTLRLVNPAALDFFAGLGIRRFELSGTGRFPKTNFGEKAVRARLKDFAVSLYYPYLNMSTARACMTGMEPRAPGEVFNGVLCRRECGVSSFRVAHPLIKEELLVRGNTVFLEFPEKFYTSERKLEQLRVDRLVYCPFL